MYGCFGNATGYEARLNGEQLGVYHELAHAKARIDWEIWNRVRQTMPGYKMLLARRETWNTAAERSRSRKKKRGQIQCRQPKQGDAVLYSYRQ